MSNPQHEGVESQPQATLCSGGCGFFANVGTSGLCSKCFREAEQVQQKLDSVTKKTAAAVARPPATPSPTVAEAAKEEEQPVSLSAAAQTSSPEEAPQEPGGGAPPSVTSSRCNVEACRKKVGLTAFKCRCGHSFCGQHRHAEGHNCSFDWKTFGRLKIADNNPQVQASKIQKI